MSSESFCLSFCCCYTEYILFLTAAFTRVIEVSISNVYSAAPVHIFKKILTIPPWMLFFFFFQRLGFWWLHIYGLCCCRMSATKWGRYLPRSCIRHLWSYCSLWNIWQSLLCVPKTLWRREERMPDSACSKTSIYEENILSRILWLMVSISVKLLKIQ